MSIAECKRCDKPIDLDYDSEAIQVKDEWIHWGCLTDEEQGEIT